MKTTFCDRHSFPIAISLVMLFLGCQARNSDSGPSKDAAQAESSKAATEISKTISEYLDALKRRDVVAAGEYWTEDSRLIGPGFNLDRSHLLEGLRSTFAAGGRVNVLNRPTIELFVHGDVAYEIAQAEEVFLNPGTALPDTIRNNMFIRWKKGSDGNWRFDRALLGPQNSK